MIARGLLLSSALLIAGCITFGPPRPCVPETNRHLQSLAVPSEAVDTISIRSSQASGQESSTRTLGHQAWVRIRGCSGRLVVVMNRHCDFERAFFHQSNCTLRSGGRGA